MKAEFVKKLDGWQGDAALYKCGTEHFIISAVNKFFVHETMAFADDEHGNLTNDYQDVACIKDVASHEALLNEMGYTL